MNDTILLVDIDVPVLGKVYDFEVDASVKVEILLEQIGSQISRKEQAVLWDEEALKAQGGEFILCETERQIVLSPQQTLAQQGVTYGARLLLI